YSGRRGTTRMDFHSELAPLYVGSTEPPSKRSKGPPFWLRSQLQMNLLTKKWLDSEPQNPILGMPPSDLTCSERASIALFISSICSDIFAIRSTHSSSLRRAIAVSRISSSIL